jgi:ABC-2 type transport system ATP-binding protein
MSFAIEARNLVKAYRNKTAVRDLSLGVRPGVLYGFLGPNGAGKSTTLRILTCFQPATSGTARVAGYDVFEQGQEVRENMGYLPESTPLYTEMRVRAYLDYRATIKGVARKDRRRFVDEAMERCHVSDVSDRIIGHLSKGYRQRVGLADALVHKPKVLILDEPTSGLDPLVQQSFYELVREAQAEGRTVFLSSHILSEVERTCDRVAIIRDGRLVKVDRTEALRDLAHHEVELRFVDEVPADAFIGIPGVSDVKVQDHTLRMRVSGPITPVVQAAARYELLDFVSREPTLEETFLAQYGTPSAEVGQA